MPLQAIQELIGQREPAADGSGHRDRGRSYRVAAREVEQAQSREQ
jgi:hypothetical protein